MIQHKRLVIVLLLIPVAVAAAAGVSLMLVPSDRVAALAERQAEAALGRDVRIDDVSLRLWPAPGVALDGFAVGGPEPDAPPLATVRRVVLRPRLLPLLRRQVVIDAILLDRPRLLIEFDSDGASNLPALAADSTREAAGNAGDAGGAGAAFLVRRFEIRDGRLAYRDERTGTAVRLDGLNQRLRLAGDVEAGQLRRIEAEGALEVEALSALLPGKLAVPIRDVRVTIEHDAVLDRAADSLALERLVVRIGEVPLEGSGTVLGLTAAAAREVRLDLSAGPLPVGELIRSLPQALLTGSAANGGSAEPPEVDGRARVVVAIRGRIGAGAVPAVEGTVDLDGISLGYKGMGTIISGLGGAVAFTLDSLATSGLEGRLLGEPLRITFTVRDPAAPAGRATIRTALDLGRAAALGVVPDSIELGGSVGLDLAYAGPLLEPADGRIDGTVRLAGVRVRTPALQESAVVEAGGIVFEGQRLRADGLQLRIGESDIAVDLELRDWLPFALGDSTAIPSLAFDTRSRLIDADAILGAPDSIGYSQLFFARMAGRPFDGRPVAEVADEIGLGLPTLPPMRVQGRLRADAMRRNGLDLRDVDIALAGDGERLELTDARFRIMGGGVQVMARIGMGMGRAGDDATEGFPAVLSFQVEDVGAAPFFDTFTPFKEHLSGSMLLAGTARMVLDRHLLPLRETVTADGTAAVAEGRLVNWPALNAFGERLGLTQLDTLSFRDWTGRFAVAGPRITLDDAVIESGDMRTRAAGSIDFSGALDLGATVELSPALASKVRGEFATRLIAAAAGADGWTPIGVRITGPSAKPSLDLDFSAATANAVAEARAEAESRARALAEEAAQKAAGNLLPGADSLSLPASADSARARVQDELKKRLCRFTKCE